LVHPIGLLAADLGGWTDGVISSFTDAMLAVPFLILVIALSAFLGPSLNNVLVAIGVSAMPVFIRLTRAQVMPPLIMQATLSIASAVIAEVSFSFLGLGRQPPLPSRGSMLNAKNYMDNASWMAVWPGASIFLLVLSFNLLGDGLHDAQDPGQK
jgi:peptide/nickel transport system permease protein